MSARTLTWQKQVASLGVNHWGWTPTDCKVWYDWVAAGTGSEFMVDRTANWRIKPDRSGGYRLADYRMASIEHDMPWPEKAERLRDVLEASR